MSKIIYHTIDESSNECRESSVKDDNWNCPWQSLKIFSYYTQWCFEGVNHCPKHWFSVHFDWKELRYSFDASAWRKKREMLSIHVRWWLLFYHCGENISRIEDIDDAYDMIQNKTDILSMWVQQLDIYLFMACRLIQTPNMHWQHSWVVYVERTLISTNYVDELIWLFSIGMWQVFLLEEQWNSKKEKRKWRRFSFFSPYIHDFSIEELPRVRS